MAVTNPASNTDDWYLLTSSGGSFRNDLSYIFSGNDGANVGGYGVRMAVSIPSGSTVLTAVPSGQSWFSGAGAEALLWSFEDALDPAAPTTLLDAQGRVSTPSPVSANWTPTDNSYVDGPDLTVALQYLVNTYGTLSSVNLMVVDNGSASGRYAGVSSYDRDQTNFYKLTYTYTAASSPSEVQLERAFRGISRGVSRGSW